MVGHGVENKSSESSGRATPGEGGTVAWKVAREAVWVAVAGVILALVANQLSPRGLDLTRDYFPKTRGLADRSTVGTNAAPVGVADRLRLNGFQVVTFDEMARLAEDPRRQNELVIFLDARPADLYAEGHIPGALHFDHYRKEQSLPAVLPQTLSADQVVVYCTGGDCEDSEFAVMILRDAGVAAEKLWIYAGGFGEWRDRKQPVVSGSEAARGNASSTP